MYEELKNLDDRTLLERYVGDPNSLEGKGADAVLRYRQYLTLKDYNRRLIIVTIVLALWGGIQTISVTIQAVAAWQSMKVSAKSPSPP